LDEYQETNRRGHAEIFETLKKVDENLQKMNENQTRITDLLMQVTHPGKDPDTYGNKEVMQEHRARQASQRESRGQLDEPTDLFLKAH
jgi:hypothetical protein